MNITPKNYIVLCYVYHVFIFYLLTIMMIDDVDEK